MRMKIKVFTTNEKGKIEFTREELEKLLNDTYAEGQRSWDYEGNISLTNPCVTPYVTTINNEETTSNTSTPKAHTIATTFSTADAEEISKHIDNIIKNAVEGNVFNKFDKLARESDF